MHSTFSTFPCARAALQRDLPGFCVTLLPARPYESAYLPERHILGFTLEGQQGMDAFGGDIRRAFHAEPWRLAFTPAGCDVFSASERGGEYLLLSIVPGVFAETFEPGRPGRLARFTNRMAPNFTGIALALRRMILSGAGSGMLAIEESGVEAIEIAGTYLGAKRAVKVGLDTHRLRRILDFLEANLADEVRLGDLARELGVSEAHLARAFKATTGTTLHAALMERRLARARLLLRASRTRDWSLASIAAETGFASHSHLSTAFRRVLGLTPSQWREVPGRPHAP